MQGIDGPPRPPPGVALALAFLALTTTAHAASKLTMATAAGAHADGAHAESGDRHRADPNPWPFLAGFIRAQADQELYAWCNLQALQGYQVPHDLSEPAAQTTVGRDGHKPTFEQLVDILGSTQDIAHGAPLFLAGLAEVFSISKSDALAVCAAVGMEALTGDNLLLSEPFRVGRLDKCSSSSSYKGNVPSTEAGENTLQRLVVQLHKLNLIDTRQIERAGGQLVKQLKVHAYLEMLSTNACFTAGEASELVQLVETTAAARRLHQTPNWWSFWSNPIIRTPSPSRSQAPSPSPSPSAAWWWLRRPPPMAAAPSPVRAPSPSPTPSPIPSPSPTPSPIPSPARLRSPSPMGFGQWWWMRRFPPPPATGNRPPNPPPPAFIPKPNPPPPAFIPKPNPPPPAFIPNPNPPPPAFIPKPNPPPPAFIPKPNPPPPAFIPNPNPPPPAFIPNPNPPPPAFIPKPNPPPPPQQTTANPPPPPPSNLPPGSPYAPPGVCVTATSGSINVDGFPSTSFPLDQAVFKLPFKNPDMAQKAATACHENGHCMDAYEINVMQVDLDMRVGCPAGKLTRLLSYNGTVPGPVFIVPTGRQTLVRFNNMIPPSSDRYPPFEPCATPAHPSTRPLGRPIAVHLHGAASLAPYDGFAEDDTCPTETKDYLWPNNQPGTLWYHDHALDITGENAHAGLAGMYIVKDSAALGTEPDRWGLDGMEEYYLQLADRVMDSNCQLVYDKYGVHEDDHYGDINLVSGIPWPVLTVQPKWVRLRLLNSAVARPYLLSIRDADGVDYSSSMCQVIAADVAYRRRPIAFPATGLFIAVAERYEVVCDFSRVRDKTLYLWNHYDKDRMKDVPMFCYSHLIMKIVVQPDCPVDCAAAPKFQPPLFNTPSAIDRVISEAEYNTALRFAKAGGCTRTFKFGRGGGEWVINGETWHTVRVAAGDVASNAWEVWCLETGGGWFHPIHIHLVEFFVLHRYPEGAYQTLEPYEAEVAKDTVQLHPGSKVAILARFGPHRGEYMFHCHNLRHEDVAMMRTFINNRPLTNSFIQTPNTVALSKLTFSTILGQLYDEYSDPKYPDSFAKPTSAIPALNANYIKAELALELYRIFYPGRLDDRATLCNPNINVWLAKTCAP